MPLCACLCAPKPCGRKSVIRHIVTHARRTLRVDGVKANGIKHCHLSELFFPAKVLGTRSSINIKRTLSLLTLCTLDGVTLTLTRQSLCCANKSPNTMQKDKDSRTTNHNCRLWCFPAEMQWILQRIGCHIYGRSGRWIGGVQLGPHLSQTFV